MHLEDILHRKEDNHLLPFLWVHGEDEATYRKMVGVIYDANIRAFCVEARPHKEFCQDKWWADMAIILDDAEKRGMKVWILDDKHFPIILFLVSGSLLFTCLDLWLNSKEKSALFHAQWFNTSAIAKEYIVKFTEAKNFEELCKIVIEFNSKIYNENAQVHFL